MIAAKPVERQQASPGTLPERRCFTIVSDSRVYGLPVDQIQTVFEIVTVTPVPLAPFEMLGLVNLRGKIVTAVSLRRRLCADRAAHEPSKMAVGLDHKGESFALVVDDVGDVLTLDRKSDIDLMPHLGAEGVKFASVHRLDSQILPMLDLDWLFNFKDAHG